MLKIYVLWGGGNIQERKQLEMMVFVRKFRDTKSDLSDYYKNRHS